MIDDKCCDIIIGLLLLAIFISIFNFSIFKNSISSISNPIDITKSKNISQTFIEKFRGGGGGVGGRGGGRGGIGEFGGSNRFTGSPSIIGPNFDYRLDPNGLEYNSNYLNYSNQIENDASSNYDISWPYDNYYPNYGYMIEMN